MYIAGYNVAFGDCFTIVEPAEKETLLVDFGSDTPSVLGSAERDILSHSRDHCFSVLLTHFHRDHINGLWETQLSRKIDIQTVYLPDILAMRETKTQFDFLQLQVLYDLFSSIVLEQKPREITLYALLKQLAAGRAKIIFLQCGSTFQFARQEFQVLWPNFQVLKVDQRIENSLSSLLRQLEVLETDSVNFPEEQKRARIRYVDDYIDLLLESYFTLASGEMRERENMLSGLEEQLQATMNGLRQRITGLPQSVWTDLRKRMASIKNQGNRISLVFQDTPEDNRSRLLMTGDITAADMKRVIDGGKRNPGGFRLAQSYTAIKAPHHGTHTHFVETLPTCGHILISNGKPAPRNRRWGKISYLYGGFYASHKNCQIHCTNSRCQLRGMRATSACMNCHGMNPCITVDPL